MLESKNTNQICMLETDLRTALEKKEFSLCYQPRLHLDSGKINGVEALIRWEHPEKGVILPVDFIPLAEETGLIIPIGEWVLRTACEQNKAWQEAGISPMVMAVNLSVRQLYQPNLVERVRLILEETGLAPEYLELEITENIMMNVQDVLPVVKELKRLGIRLSLDDFGTGYSPLHYLKEFPIDSIKIDQSFICNCRVDQKDATIVKAIIAMAHQLKLEVIAEEIETKEHLIFLQQNLCNMGQGYLFSEPLPPDQLIQQFYQIEQIVHREGISQEFSRQKWLEEELEQARQELRDTLRQQQGMMFKFIEYNKKFIHTLCDGELLYRMNFTPEQILGKGLRDFLPDDLAERKAHYYRRAWENKENVTYEEEVNGVWYLASLRPVQRGGEVVEVIGSCIDITERKESEERYQKVVEYSPKGIVIHRDGKFLYANPCALKTIKEEDVVGKEISICLHPDSYELSKKRLAQTEVGEELPITEMKLIAQDGEVIDVEIGSVSIPYGGSSAILTMYSDITDRKKAARDLEESKERYRRLVNLSPEPIVVHSQGIIKYMNKAGVKILGFTHPKELLGKPILDFVHPDDRKMGFERIQCLAQENESEVELWEYRMIRPDGTIFYVEGIATGIMYDGEPAIQGMFRDITARKEVEEALRQSEEKYRLIAENMQDLIGVLDTKCIVRYASPSHETILGFPTDVYEGNRAFDLVHPDDISYVQTQYENSISSKTPCYIEFRCKHVSGGWVYVEAWGTPVLDGNNEVEHLVIVARDISERKKADQLIRKSEKLSVAGQLAAGVAHEIRNPLTSIKGFIQLLQKETNNPLYTDVILSEIDRLEDIVQGFLSLAKPQAPQMKEIDGRLLLQQVVLLFETQALLKNVQIVQEYSENLPLIYCDGNQMKQVYMNILQNAVEAMPNGGVIKIQVLWHSADSILFRFIDQGQGISKERIKNIGEPFFSTKEKGTGLGLMVSQKIVQEHGGTMGIDSTVNQGTTVDVILPIKPSFVRE
ncbi:PAS domain S-box protein [Peribacillus asahii]|uniref:histidine kinase n=1 Tax=Peribacillus asahii TaxID=228899 RepID=A0A3T0KQQ5_9BACI|nr:PAS domain S-box protein [Peribacillus asahii]AZV42551.1 hypothetical protein BAOM_1942 [Peribacillus asahii]USK86829.1 PAS domain S-box protein [Peribacillus asahii]